MKGMKPWQIVVIVAAVLAVSYTVYRSLTSDAPRLTTRLTLVDITTGDLFEASTAKTSAVIPEKNPDTGAFTLFPVAKDDKGVWHVSTRYLASLDPKVQAAALVSAQSGEVKVKPGSPRAITLGK
jgi:hypothetical protein